MSEFVPTTGLHYELDLEGLEGELKFTTCGLPTVNLTAVQALFQDANSNPETATVPVAISYGDVTVSRAYDESNAMAEWINEGNPAEGGGTGAVTKKDVKLTLKNGDDVVREWTLEGCCPISHSGGGTLASTGGSVLVEGLTLHFDHLVFG